MITKLFEILKRSFLYVKDHPQILFALMLIIFVPLLFLYTGQQFLDVGHSNQDRLEKDRIGLMQDTLASMLIAIKFDNSSASQEFARIKQLNPDIIEYKLAKKEGSNITILLASKENLAGTAEQNTDEYRTASLQSNESIIFESRNENARLWSAYRAVENPDGEMYFIYTQFSLEQTDKLFKSREQSAYFSLVFVYFFMIALAYWHIKLTDYRYLYMKAQKANEMKDMFTNMIAHELRAPLTAIKGYAAMLDERLQNPEEKKYASRITESSERLITIVNDLLDVARIQSGKLSIEAVEVDISSVVNSVLDEQSAAALTKEISFKREGITAKHLALADPKRLHQALTNLVNNAIKYTEKGAITVALEDTHAGIEIRVKDTGMGISSEDQKKLFAPFFRVASKDVSQITGTGLGMWITKELIELMGAKIGVESIKGVGTHIVISIPKTIRIS